MRPTRELIHDYLNDALDEDGLAELESRLEADAEARRLFVEMSEENALLAETLRSGSELEAADAGRFEPEAILFRADSSLRGKTRRGSAKRRAVRRRVAKRYWKTAVWASAAAAAFLLIAAPFMMRQRPPDGGTAGPRPALGQPGEDSDIEPVRRRMARIAAAKGDVRFARADADQWYAAEKGTVLLAGDRVRTHSSRARIRFETGSLLYLNRFTSLALHDSAGPPGIRLAAGEVYVETVTKDRGFFVETPHGRAVDQGTRFGIETEIEKGTTVVVVEGKVDASTDAGRAEVRAGQEVLLARLTSPPGEVREAPDLERRFAWVAGAAPRAGEVLLAQDFERPARGGPPAGWECRSGHWIVAREANGNQMLKTTGAARFMPAAVGRPDWTDYALILDARGPVICPIVFYQGFDAHYRIVFEGQRGYCVKRQAALKKGTDEVIFLPQPDAPPAVFHQPRDNALPAKGVAWERLRRLGLDIRANRWYSVRIEARREGKGVRIRARVWPRGRPEPAGWHIDIIDDGLEGPPILRGRVGYFAYYMKGHAPHVIDNVRVMRLK